MSEPRMIRRTDAVVLTVLCSVLLGVIGLIIGFKLALPAGKPAQPPIIVVGGSIYGDASGGSGTWYPASQCNQSATTSYCATITSGTSYILSSNLYNPRLNQTVPNGQNWAIHITDENSDGEGIWIGNSPGICKIPGCSATQSPDLNHVYIAGYDPSNSAWTYVSPNLYYQDTSDSCKKSYDPNKHGGNCEHPVDATLFLNGVQQSPSSTCQKKNGCAIGVGSPAYP